MSTTKDSVAAWLFRAVVLAVASLGAGGAGAEPALVPETVLVSEGPFIAGSSETEREAAYRLDEQAYGHARTREQGWYEGEHERQEIELAAYRIATTPITNAQYEAFVAASGHRAPSVTAEQWQGYGLIHPFERTRRHAWQAGKPPRGRENHPVVLVSHADAVAYARWLSRSTGTTWRLPSEFEWEKAARGTDARRFPWGDSFDPARLNSHDAGPFDTSPVGAFRRGASPYGALDMAGQVYEWTSTAAGDGRHIVKGGSWDDKGCGVCRPAARHGRPDHLKHILIGFRLVRDQRGM